MRLQSCWYWPFASVTLSPFALTSYVPSTCSRSPCATESVGVSLVTMPPDPMSWRQYRLDRVTTGYRSCSRRHRMCVLGVERCHCRRIPGIEGVGPRSRDLVGRGPVLRRRWATSTRRERDACGRGDGGQHYSTAVQVLHLQTPSRRRLTPPRCVPSASWIKEFRCCRGRSMHRASLRCVPIPRRDALAWRHRSPNTPVATPEKFAPFRTSSHFVGTLTSKYVNMVTQWVAWCMPRWAVTRSPRVGCREGQHAGNHPHSRPAGSRSAPAGC